MELEHDSVRSISIFVPGCEEDFAIEGGQVTSALLQRLSSFDISKTSFLDYEDNRATGLDYGITIEHIDGSCEGITFIEYMSDSGEGSIGVVSEKLEGRFYGNLQKDYVDFRAYVFRVAGVPAQ